MQFRIAPIQIIHGRDTYITQVVSDREDGFIGLELIIDKADEPYCVAKVIYWDAMGQYYVETCKDIPVLVLEQLIAETKRVVGIT